MRVRLILLLLAGLGLASGGAAAAELPCANIIQPDGKPDCVPIRWTGTGGTVKSADFTADCLTDPQPYLVDTSAAVVTATLGNTGIGNLCSFSDYKGSFASHNLTIHGQGGQTVLGGASTTLATNWQTQTLMLDQLSNWLPVSSGPQ